MAIYKQHGWCEDCRGRRVIKKRTPDRGFQMILSIITGGIWLLIWLLLELETAARAWTCVHCNYCCAPERGNRAGAWVGTWMTMAVCFSLLWLMVSHSH